MGFVHPDSPDYGSYLGQLTDVMPEFAIFSSVAQSLTVIKPSAA
jgi:hypothetical protein